MIGVDITSIARFKNKINNFNFIKRILHPNEIEEFKHAIDQPKFLATRWAIKEALYKCNNKLFRFDRILLKVKNYQYKFDGFTISTSIEGDYCIAFVMKGQHES